MGDQKQKFTALYERTNQNADCKCESERISRQKRLLADYAESHDLLLTKHYTDVGISGNRFDRPALNEMISEIENGNIGTVIVENISRIGRNIVEVSRIARLFEANGVRLISVRDEIDTFNQAQKGGAL